VRFLEKPGLWEHDVEPTLCACGRPTELGFSDTSAGQIVPACSVKCWGNFWDKKVRPQGGQKTPRMSETNMSKWSKRVNAMQYTARDEPGLHIYTQGSFDVIEYRLPDLSLAGALFHFPRTTSDGRREAGRIAVWVFPAHTGQGIGSKLGRAAARHYGINLSAQMWSRKGAKMASRAFRDHPLAQAYSSEEVNRGNH
jgi:GNAT superfamily N-acetyltransferase